MVAFDAEESSMRPRRIGLIYSPTPTLVLEFVKLNGRLYHRRVPLPRLTTTSDSAELHRLIEKLKDRAPRPINQRIVAVSTFETTDFNKLDNDELAEVKAKMDQTFRGNQVRPDDPGFIYDLEVSFDGGAGIDKTNDWDEWSEHEKVML
ncbi:hypothetical protein Pmar_PMAR026739 [Perkinsus marinus ATCC 50983]|uniref:Centrosomal protein of 19 kDa n=1 Tax=Perkinsus marinus (strain ATCC 50983 / TXsc) TaxID=423536 RepID=C5K5V3_PERM5|nr:hypothetical protein Pmar_PMAR025419 [Perkinsus marinus ATCC 50983]XP_002788353.1 hypothetical protein Pmar_PMAR026739 [Perkinsus marinus ATCC 50983]EER17467.1 hypothetical protein Pmar_PMAR025419 [Perkinsus marinus ATCC 50983]EER20149.1 hypothetical protein Pmar_PMAR026739 [Perkinsus marinus ATCC 50983]|eukprot:XP_002785671.1 hypothetical protein Pmar_PMAR025419 [Perkinsus marinus ATCC 50983]